LKLARVAKLPWVGPLLALVAVYALFVALVPETFGRAANLVNMARQTAVVGVASCGMTMVIMLGGIDLSVGSVVALTTVVIASLLKAGFGPVAAASLGIVVAAATGAASGALTTWLRVTPFIVTLGAMSMLRGAAKGLAHEQMVYVDVRGIDALVLPPSQPALLFAPAVWLMIAVAVAVAVLLRRTRFGRHVVAIGSNEETARLCGVPVERVKVLVYALSGGLAGLAGVIELGTLTVGDPTDSAGLELKVIAAVVIGGGSLSGGEGSIAGALAGALLMTVIQVGCQYRGLPNWVQEVVAGAIIVSAVALDRLRRGR
jgi:ribose/xylose/arabinose/galactoside ABC-type transport system permease subunit